MLLDIETLRAAISTVSQSLPSTHGFMHRNVVVCAHVWIFGSSWLIVDNVVVMLARMHATELQTMFTRMQGRCLVM